MLSIKDESIKSAFAIMLDKLSLFKNEILKPLHRDLMRLNDGGRYAEIAEIEKQLQKINEQIKVMTGFVSQGYLDTALFNEKNNVLQAEATKLRERKNLLQGNTDSDITRVAITDELIKFISKPNEPNRYDDEVFNNFVEQIIVFSKTEIGFKLKNGLTLRERLVR